MRTRERARVELLTPRHRGAVEPHGPTGSVQEAELTLPSELLDELWQAGQLERLAAAYWRYLRRISLGLIRIVEVGGAPAVALVHRRLVLLRFRRPRYETGPGFGEVTWPIERGLLVARRGRGHLRIAVRRVESVPGDEPGHSRLRVLSEVHNFYPFLRGGGRFARIGARLYAATQLRIHIAVTNGFLRSLAQLDLPLPEVQFPPAAADLSP